MNDGSTAPPSGRWRIVPAVLTGLYCWGLTVLPPAVAHDASALQLAAAWAALPFLLASLFAPRPWSIYLGLDAFVGLSLLSWWFGREQVFVPPFGVYGTWGWLAFTLAFGAISTPDAGAGEEGVSLDLSPRTPNSRLAAVVLVICFVSAGSVLSSAWGVERPHVAVLAHVLALSVSLLLFRASSDFAIALQVRGTKLERRSLWRPVLPLALLTVTLAIIAALLPSLSG